jgi:hypothetical protein
VLELSGGHTAEVSVSARAAGEKPAEAGPTSLIQTVRSFQAEASAAFQAAVEALVRRWATDEREYQ